MCFSACIRIPMHRQTRTCTHTLTPISLFSRNVKCLVESREHEESRAKRRKIDNVTSCVCVCVCTYKVAVRVCLCVCVYTPFTCYVHSCVVQLLVFIFSNYKVCWLRLHTHSHIVKEHTHAYAHNCTQLSSLFQRKPMKTRGRQPDDVTALLEVSCLLFKTQLTVKLAYFWAPPHTARPFIHFPHLYLNVFTCVRTHVYVCMYMEVFPLCSCIVSIYF